MVALAIGPALAADNPKMAAWAGLTPIGFVAAYVWRQIWVDKQRLSLHRSHIELQQGVWWRTHVCARYDNVKKLTVGWYPGAAAGWLQVFVAGEQIAEHDQGNSIPIPYSLMARFVLTTDDIGAQLDEVIEGVRDPGDDRSVPARSGAHSMRPHRGQLMLQSLVVSIILLPFASVLLVWAWVAAKRVEYTLEPHRVVVRRGVFFRRETSMLVGRIDSLEQRQGAIGKLFGTGTVTLHTAGSSRPDLALHALPNHAAMHAAIRQRYAGDGAHE
jgi:membrane protein YdbS with pleckstrin-like domain